MGIYSKLASAIYNDIHAGLKGLVNEFTLSIEQIEDEIVNMRMKLIQEKLDNNISYKKQFVTGIKCIKVDCEPIDNCECFENTLPTTPMPHFEIPVPFSDMYDLAITYIGTTDMEEEYTVFTNFKKIRAMKHRRVPIRKPYVFINPAPNKRGFLDGYIFNAPYVQQISIFAVFKDLRTFLDEYCCEITDNSESLNTDIQNAIVTQKIQAYQSQLSNDRKTVI